MKYIKVNKWEKMGAISHLRRPLPLWFALGFTCLLTRQHLLLSSPLLPLPGQTSCMLLLLSCFLFSGGPTNMDKVIQTFWSNLGPIKTSFLVSCPNIQIFLSFLHLFVVGGCYCLFLTGAGWDQLAAFQSQASAHCQLLQSC